jgi:hypothetical protein
VPNNPKNNQCVALMLLNLSLNKKKKTRADCFFQCLPKITNEKKNFKNRNHTHKNKNKNIFIYFLKDLPSGRLYRSDQISSMDLSVLQGLITIRNELINSSLSVNKIFKAKKLVLY